MKTCIEDHIRSTPPEAVIAWAIAIVGTVRSSWASAGDTSYCEAEALQFVSREAAEAHLDSTDLRERFDQYLLFVPVTRAGLPTVNGKASDPEAQRQAEFIAELRRASLNLQKVEYDIAEIAATLDVQVICDIPGWIEWIREQLRLFGLLKAADRCSHSTLKQYAKWVAQKYLWKTAPVITWALLSDDDYVNLCRAVAIWKHAE